MALSGEIEAALTFAKGLKKQKISYYCSNFQCKRAIYPKSNGCRQSFEKNVFFATINDKTRQPHYDENVHGAGLQIG